MTRLPANEVAAIGTEILAGRLVHCCVECGGTSGLLFDNVDGHPVHAECENRRQRGDAA